MLIGAQTLNIACSTHTEGIWKEINQPDGYAAMPERRNFDVDVHPERSHEAPDGPHHAEHWHIPHVVEHARAVGRQAVCVQAEVAVAAEMRVQHIVRVLLRHGTHGTSASVVAKLTDSLRGWRHC